MWLTCNLDAWCIVSGFNRFSRRQTVHGLSRIISYTSLSASPAEVAQGTFSRREGSQQRLSPGRRGSLSAAT